MKDRYLYRAKRIDNGEWVEGIPIQTHIGLFICYEENPHYCSRYGYMEIDEIIKVDKNTLCQCTGIADNSGGLIWENDIVGFTDMTSTENGYAEHDCVGEVIWDKVTLSFQVTGRLSAESYEVLDDCMVIGNIFDNPKLMEA